MDLSRQAGRLHHHELLRARQSLLSNGGNGRDCTQCSRGGDGNENGLGLRHAASHVVGLHFVLTSYHSITSSARASSGGGNSSPSAFAVYCSFSTSVSCVHHEMSCWPPSMSYVAPVSAVLLMM